MFGGGGSIYFFGSTLMGEEAKCDFLDVFGLLLCIYCVFFCLCLAYNGIAQSQLKNIEHNFKVVCHQKENV